MSFSMYLAIDHWLRPLSYEYRTNGEEEVSTGMTFHLSVDFGIFRLSPETEHDIMKAISRSMKLAQMKFVHWTELVMT